MGLFSILRHNVLCIPVLLDKKRNFEVRIVRHVCFGWVDQYCRLKIFEFRCT